MVPAAGMLPGDETSAEAAIATLVGQKSVVEWPFNHDPNVLNRT